MYKSLTTCEGKYLFKIFYVFFIFINLMIVFKWQNSFNVRIQMIEFIQYLLITINDKYF